MTAKELFEERYVIGCANSQNDIETMLIEFAEFHVKEALKVASKKSKTKEGQITDYKLTNSILNAYPLKNIK